LNNRKSTDTTLPQGEGGLGAPVRHPIPWQEPSFYDEDELDIELRRVFDICHGCRRCFNLCDSFPRLFDLIDESESGELDTVDSKDFKQVVDACTLCDMCFMTKCPYVPPHQFDLDFPHLMLRYRAVENAQNKIPYTQRQISKTDRNGRVMSYLSLAVNWTFQLDNKFIRTLIEFLSGVDRRAILPKFYHKTFNSRSKSFGSIVNKSAPAYGRKAVLYSTCFVNFNNPNMGELTQKVLAHNGVITQAVYPNCCGMPQLEQGNIEKVADNAMKVAKEMRKWIDDGYDIIALTPSCSLMLKYEWPLILAGNEDVIRLSKATFDITEYIVNISRNEGLTDGLQALSGGIALHLACHSRAQNMGKKASEMLNLIPDGNIKVIERCSGHGGTWGVYKNNFETALKVGRPVVRQAGEMPFISSECPLAADHILQGIEFQKKRNAENIEDLKLLPKRTYHPLELFAMSYGLFNNNANDKG